MDGMSDIQSTSLLRLRNVVLNSAWTISDLREAQAAVYFEARCHGAKGCMLLSKEPR